MRSILLVVSTWLASTPVLAQELSIENCYALARENYPQVKQYELIKKSNEYSVGLISKGYLPQVTINGQATYQSDVTQVPVNLPNVDLPTISKDQYKVYGEITKTLYDGGTLKIQRRITESNSVIEESKLDVELYKLKERINQLFFGILILEQQLQQTELLKKDIQIGIARATAAIEQGTTLKSNLDLLQVELLKTGQRTIELNSARDAYLNMLGLFVNKNLNEYTVFLKPSRNTKQQGINRAELLLFTSQRKLVDAQEQSLRVKNLPKIGVFFQGGYGRPALNMLNNNFDFYYVGGIRLSWSLSGLYTRNYERASLALNRDAIDLQQQTFLFNTEFALKQLDSEINKVEELLKTDDEIISLRKRIKDAALAKMENGMISSADYIREVNAEDQAKQAFRMHEIQLLMAQYNQQSTSGNL